MIQAAIWFYWFSETHTLHLYSPWQRRFHTFKINSFIVWTRLATMGTRQIIHAPTKWWRRYGSPVRTNYIPHSFLSTVVFDTPPAPSSGDVYFTAAILTALNEHCVLVSIRIDWLSVKSVILFFWSSVLGSPPFCKILLDVRWHIRHIAVSSGGCQLYRQDSWRRRGTDSCCLPTPQSLFNNGLEIGRNQPRRACQQPPQ